MAQDQMDSAKRKKTLAGSQAAHMQSLARRMQVWGTLAGGPNAVPGLPFLWVAAAAHGLPKCSLHVAAA